MTWTAQIVKDTVAKHHLIVAKPKKRVEGFEVYSGSVYRVAFAFGKVLAAEVNGTALTEGTSVALAAGQFYWDGSYLYVRKSDSSAVATANWVVAQFELYLSTKEQMFHRIPTDSTSEQVQFRGVITQAPVVDVSSGDNLFGFSPIASTSVVCAMDAEYLQELLHGTTFTQCEINIFHVAGKFAVANVQKIMSGVGGTHDHSDTNFSLNIMDRSYKLDVESSNGSYDSRFSTSTRTGDSLPDPVYQNRPIRSVYGIQKSVRGVCMDYKDESPANTDNRRWAFMTNGFGVGSFTITVTAYSTDSIFNVSVADAKKLKTYLDLGFFKVYGHSLLRDVNSVDTTTGEITLASGMTGVGVSSSIAVIPFANAYLISQGNWYKLNYGTHFTTTNLNDDTFGMELLTTVESGYGISVLNPSTDYVIADMMGAQIAPTFGGNPISTAVGAVANPIVVLYHILKDRVGLEESEIDGDAFIDLAAEVTDQIAMAIPLSEADDFEDWKTIIARLLTTGFLKAFYDEEGRYTIKRVGPIGAVDATLTDDDIQGELKFEYSFDDICAVRAINGPAEYYLLREKTAILGGATSGKASFYASARQYYYFWRANSELYLYQTGRIRDVETYFYFNQTLFDLYGDGQFDYANKLAYIMGERRGRVSLYAKSGAWSLNLGDAVAIERKKLPGFAYDEDTNRTRNFIVCEIRKELNGVALVLDDQKGIEDADDAGDWV